GLQKKTTFSELLRKINDIPGDFWIRLLTSHPKDMSDELIKTIVECKKVTEYIHLPVQSGDNEILKRMNRGYTIRDYLSKIRFIREKLPNVEISTDIIVGFPGETKKQFENTAKL
ncbi:MAG: radical SAM protein, partial [Candidatus Aenigmarchaeota archaeon]|nr:radical SAM protein [Candidatus Aenigmarchaeota archaeon]